MHQGIKRLALGMSMACGLAVGATAQQAPQASAPAASQAEERVLFAIVYRAGPRWKPGIAMKDQGLREHFYYVKALHEAGHIFSGGAMGPDGGLILLHARDQAEADRIMAGDPAVRDGIFVGEARRYTPRFLVDRPLKPTVP